MLAHRRRGGHCHGMIQLAVFRHAKSSWDNPGLDDFDRPLNERGRRAAPVMGQMLASMKFSPEVVLCSPAKRTRETLEAITPDLASAKPSVLFDEQLYLASPEIMLDCLRSAGANAKRVLLIGHNPGLHALAVTLASSGDTGQLTRLRNKFPTAALALLSLGGDTFASIATTGGHLEAFVTPKDRY